MAIVALARSGARVILGIGCQDGVVDARIEENERILRFSSSLVTL